MTDGERIVALPRRQQHAPPQPCKTLQAFARLPRRQQAGVTALLSTQTVRDAAGFDHGVGHPSCLRVGQKHLSTGGKSTRRLKLLSGVADTVIEAG
jgi:hypothetical protein